ncbi:MAG: hypothetical protein ACRD2N_25800 [Vicinamibacterales bacterium]
MQTRQAIGVVVALGVAASFAILRGAPTSIDVAAQGRQSGSTGVPKFEVAPGWAKIPNGWVLGQVASAAADEKDHIWILHRPRVVRGGQKTGPPVMEFDADGNYVQGWGGDAPGYEWPSSEHGIYVDPKGFVWVGGQGNEDQILKFTKAGKFVMQIGKGGNPKTNKDTKNLNKPADVFVYSKTNELFVADGYGNKRIIVFDADTGAFKRMWGAYGNVPLDDPPEAAPAAAGPGRGPGANRNRVPAKDLLDSDPTPTQFSTIHGVKVSNDGLVYAADRGGKRVQVFTTEGKYMTQAWVDRWCEAAGEGCGNGQTVASVAFSADPEQRFLYVASRSPARIWVYDRKTLKPLDSFGRAGVAPGEFFVLHHMTTDSKGNLFTSEVQDGRRVQKFAFKGLVARPQ